MPTQYRKALLFGTELKPKKKTRVKVLLSHFLANQAVPAREPKDPEVILEVGKWATVLGLNLDRGDFDMSKIPIEQVPHTFQRLCHASGIALGWTKLPEPRQPRKRGNRF